MWRLTFLLLLALPCSADTNPDSQTEQLFGLINARLELMQTVAAWKWQHHVPIEDLEREAIVLDSAAASALNRGIDPATARTFFSAQIEAAKQVQSYWFDRYLTARPRGQAPDLSETREQLIELGDRITAAMAQTGAIDPRTREAFKTIVNVEGLAEARRDALFDALTSISLFPSRLDQILSTGAIRVGTTGDYAPFSFADNGNAPEGIDIDMAGNLASSLGVRVVFVPTTWPTLMADLHAGRFDIGMSGVSRTLARARTAYFSPPYHVGGKTPIARCSDIERFSSLSAINQPDVRVIVNPGGTNFAFASDNLDKAQVRLFDDNRAIFDEIAEGRADVMITDMIEVQLQSALDERLCAAMPGKTFTYQEKAYLLPQDSPLKEFVGTWLEIQRENGTLDQVFARHLELD